MEHPLRGLLWQMSDPFANGLRMCERRVEGPLPPVVQEAREGCGGVGCRVGSTVTVS
jgi:hypothetical protein